MGNLIKILFKPTDVFVHLRERKGGWVLPWLVFAVLSVVIVWLESPAVMATAKATLEQSVANSNAADQLPGMELFTEITTYVSAAVSGFASPFLVGGLLMLVNLFVRGEAQYMNMVKVSIFQSVPGLIGGLITGLLIRLTDATNVADVSLNAAAFLPEKKGALFALLSLLNPFAIWSVVLLIIGVTVMTRRSKKAVALWVVIPWVILTFLSLLIQK